MNFLKKIFRIKSVNVSPVPHLENKAEFEAELKEYKPSEQTKQILAQTPLVTLTAPTATGRNTIIKELLKNGRYHFIVSDTTRPPRMNSGVWERNGVEYFFRTEPEMLAEIKNGEFVEAEVIHGQQVSGISVREIEKAHSENKIAINDVDIEGGINIARLKPDAITICLLPPSFEEWMARINKRSSFEPDELHRRLQQATKVLRLALDHNHFIFVINDDLDLAIKTVNDIAVDGQRNPEEENKARALAQKLYDETASYLRQNAPENPAF